MFVVTEIDPQSGQILDVHYAESSGAGCVEWCKREFQKGFASRKILEAPLIVKLQPPADAGKVWGVVEYSYGLPGDLDFQQHRFVIREVSDYSDIKEPVFAG